MKDKEIDLLENYIIQTLIKLRKEKRITQEEIYKKSGLTQQMVYRMKKVDNSQILANFLKYIKVCGLKIKIE